MPDEKRNLLHLNPGACGKYGWHKKKTIMRFDVLENKIDKLEIIELN
jgi:predicted phosphodiesterase